MLQLLIRIGSVQTLSLRRFKFNHSPGTHLYSMYGCAPDIPESRYGLRRQPPPLLYGKGCSPSRIMHHVSCITYPVTARHPHRRICVLCGRLSTGAGRGCERSAGVPDGEGPFSAQPPGAAGGVLGGDRGGEEIAGDRSRGSRGIAGAGDWAAGGAAAEESRCSCALGLFGHALDGRPAWTSTQDPESESEGSPGPGPGRMGRTDSR